MAAHSSLFTMYLLCICRYISEQKATSLGRGEGGGEGESGVARTYGRARTQQSRAVSVHARRTSAPTDRLESRRILIIMKGETLFVGQELNL